MWGRSHFTIDTAFFERVAEVVVDANLDFFALFTDFTQVQLGR